MSIICVYNWEPLQNRDGPGGIQYLCSLSAGVPIMGTIWGRWTKKASDAQGFIMALGLFWDNRDCAYLEHPMASALLNLGGTVSSCQVPITWR